jgi:DNA invertase Pin-like site-specific DNA recombinase
VSGAGSADDAPGIFKHGQPLVEGTPRAARLNKHSESEESMVKGHTMRAATWTRVSTDRQDDSNQLPDIERLCAHRGWEITKRYSLSDVSAFNGAHRETLAAMLADAHRGEFDVLVVWAADRITREGIEELLRLVRELRERNVALVSVQEPWLSGSDATTELLAAIAAWMANQESARRSERIRAGLARRRGPADPQAIRRAQLAQQRFARVEAQYLDAISERRETFLTALETCTVRELAARVGISPSAVQKIVGVRGLRRR